MALPLTGNSVLLWNWCSASARGCRPPFLSREAFAHRLLGELLELSQSMAAGVWARTCRRSQQQLYCLFFYLAWKVIQHHFRHRQKCTPRFRRQRGNTPLILEKELWMKDYCIFAKYSASHPELFTFYPICFVIVSIDLFAYIYIDIDIEYLSIDIYLSVYFPKTRALFHSIITKIRKFNIDKSLLSNP